MPAQNETTKESITQEQQSPSSEKKQPWMEKIQVRQLPGCAKGPESGEVRLQKERDQHVGLGG